MVRLGLLKGSLKGSTITGFADEGFTFSSRHSLKSRKRTTRA